MKKKVAAITLGLFLLSSPCYAMQYTVTAPSQGLFGIPTSVETVSVASETPVNTDRSKNAALIPPVFGSPTADLPDSGAYLTPNLVNRENTIQSVSNGGTGVTIVPPAIAAGGSVTVETHYTCDTNITDVTSDMYYNAGHIGTLRIPEIDLAVKVYEGTDEAALKKGAGHFETTSIWDGNVALAGHNRGVANHFGKIHTLSEGDKITFTTKLGTREYRVYSVTKIHKDNVSVLNATDADIITLITCVKNQSEYRWCVQGIQVD